MPKFIEIKETFYVLTDVRTQARTYAQMDGWTSENGFIRST